MPRPARIGRRLLARAALFAFLLSCALLSWASWSAHVRADEPPPAPPVPEEPPAAAPLGSVRTDVAGFCTLKLEEAEAALDAEKPDVAAARLAEACERDLDVLVPAPAHLRGAAGTHWPVRDAVEALAGRLPARLLPVLAQRVRPGSSALDLQRAAQGDGDALRRLCRAPVITDDEIEGLAALAEHEREGGRPEAAAALLSRRLRARPTEQGHRAWQVMGRLADALEVVGDEAALDRLLASVPAPPTEPEGAAEDAALALLRRRVGDALRRAQRPRAPAAATVEVPVELVPLWALDLTDPGLRLGTDRTDMDVMTGVHAEPGLVLVHAARTVRRVDPLTGRLRWAFPAGPQGWDYDPKVKYLPHDLPLRCVTRAGDLALAVLGDPGGAGSFKHLGLELDITGPVRESRARLVALDLETGALRWTSGSARETHPVLSDRATVCSSPPLVVGERIYVLFGRRFGTVEHYAACLERATGALVWLAFLGTAESGREPGLDFSGRVDFAPVRAVPWGARPSLERGELCVTPHAGFAAGLDPVDGTRRWLRALPRFALEGGATLGLEDGHSGRNVPLAVPGGWVLAPMDAPTVLSLQRGTGLLSWMLPVPEPEEGTRFRDLLGLGPGPDGRSAVRVSGVAPALLDTFRGSLGVSGAPWSTAFAVGRALDLGRVAVRVPNGQLEVSAWWGESDVPVVGPQTLNRAEWDAPPVTQANVFRAGEVWLLAGDQALLAYAARGADAQLLATAAAEAGASGPARAALLAVASRVGDRPQGLVAALEEARDDAAARAVVGQAVVDALVRQQWVPAPDRLRAVLEVLERLPLPQRDRAFELASGMAEEAGRHDDAVRLFARWIDTETGLLRVPLPALAAADDPDGEGTGGDWWPAPARIRGDLVAAAALRRLRAAGQGLDALAERDRATEALVARAAGAPAPFERIVALREAVRRAAGTPAATTGRTQLVQQLVYEQRFDEAASVAADLRLDPPLGVDGAAARIWAARWQLREGAWLAKAGDDLGARSLLADLLRWVPSGTKDDEGRTASELATLLRERGGFTLGATAKPERSLDVWRAVGGPSDPEDRRGIAFLGVEGPGAGRLADHVLLTRGLTLEVWSAATGARVAELPGDDEGWFGSGLQDLPPWLPERGVRVTHLVAGQPADRSGVQPGDLVLSLGGAPLAGSADFMSRIASAPRGTPQPIEALRGGRPVVASLTPGRRPIKDGANAVDRTRLWAAPDGRVLVPGRLGLSWLDVPAARRTALWRWDGPGTVQHVDVIAGDAYVLVRRIHDDDLLVAVHLVTGAERWRRALHGPVVWVRGTGSALHVQADDPGRAFVLDRADGSVRAVLPLVDGPSVRFDGVRSATHARAETAACAAGRLWILRPSGHGSSVDAVVAVDTLNSTTCVQRAASREPLRVQASTSIVPSIAADAYVAVIANRLRVRVFEPDPVADRVERWADLGASELLTEMEHHGGPLDADSRVLVGGRTVYVVRNRGRLENGRGITTMVFGADEGGSGPLKFRMLDHDPPLLSGASDTILQSIDVHPDGLMLAAFDFERTAKNDFPRGVVWIAAAEDDAAQRVSGLRSWEVHLAQARRGPAVRSGRWIFVPTDQGADLVPIEPGAPR